MFINTLSFLLRLTERKDMNNTWTFAQYRLFRVFFGSYLLMHFLTLFPFTTEIFSSRGVLCDGSLSPILNLIPNILNFADGPIVLQSMSFIAMVAALGLILGKHDKISALILWYVLACFFGRNPLIANPSLPYIGWMLLLHVAMPSPKDSEMGQKWQKEPQWQFPKPLYFAVWFIMAVSYTYSGYTKLLSPSWVSGDTIQLVLENPLSRDNWVRSLFLSMPPFFLKFITLGILWLETLFVPLAFFPRLRPWIWLGMLFAHLGFLTLLNLGDLSVGMILLHMISFNPAWLAPSQNESMTQKAKIYYDGFCGFCHKTVQFVLQEDITHHYQFAPLQGVSFQEYCQQNAIDIRIMPDSLVLITSQGQIFYKSEAFVHILMSLGGYWRILGLILRFIPRIIRDSVYDFIGKIRHRILEKPETLCPLIPEEFRYKFETLQI